VGAIHNRIENLLNEHDVARIVGLSVASVRRRRLLKLPPKYIKIGASVRYRPKDVESWIEAQASSTPALTGVAR
jgi:predicted DNA-binding transcriptional regulator AlpA